MVARHRGCNGGVDASGLTRHYSVVSTLTIELTDDLAARLAEASERMHLSPAQIVQEALAKALPTAEAEASNGKSLYDALAETGALGCFDSGVSDLATNPEHMKDYGKWRR